MCRATLLEQVKIPHEYEITVEGFADGIIDKNSTSFLEVDTQFLHKKGMLFAKSLVCPTSGMVPLQIANT